MASSTGNIKSDEENSAKGLIKHISENGEFSVRYAWSSLVSLRYDKGRVKFLNSQAFCKYFLLNFGKMHPGAW